MYKKSPAKAKRGYNAKYTLGIDPKQLYSKQFEATLITWSQIDAPQAGFEALTPYYVAIVELPDGRKVTTQLVDVMSEEDLRVGAKLRPVFRKVYEAGSDGIINYGVKFRLS